MNSQYPEAYFLNTQKLSRCSVQGFLSCFCSLEKKFLIVADHGLRSSMEDTCFYNVLDYLDVYMCMFSGCAL